MAGFMNWNFTRSADDRIDTVVWSVSNTQTILELTNSCIYDIVSIDFENSNRQGNSEERNAP